LLWSYLHTDVISYQYGNFIYFGDIVVPLKEFFLLGKIIDKDNRPISGSQVKAYEHHLVLLTDKQIGQALTKDDGTFEIKFGGSIFEQIEESIKGGPHVYLAVSYEGGKLLKTKVTRIQKEIEYHIKLVEDTPDPGAIDIYGDSTRRTISTLNGAGAITNNERINLDSLISGNLPPKIKLRFQNIRNSYDEATKNFANIQALLDGVISSTLQEHHLGTIGYDGPQVPRNVWHDGDYDVIIWPRKEEFKRE
jgi:hypothetical protein